MVEEGLGYVATEPVAQARSAAATSSASGRCRAARSRCWSATSAARASRSRRPSAMVRFFVEARALDTESPAEVLAQANRILRTRLRRGGFATAFLAVVDDGRAALLQRRPPAAVPAARGRRVASRCPAAGCRWASRTTAGTRSARSSSTRGDVLFAATDGLLEVRRERALLRRRRGCPSCSPSTAARRRRSSSPSVSSRQAQEWAPVLHDDVVVLALRRAPELELRDEPASSPAAQALYAEYQALVRERLGQEFEPTEDDLRHRARVRGGARRLRRPLRARHAGRVRRLPLARAGGERDQAHVRDRRRAPSGPRAAGCWPSSSGAATASRGAPHPAAQHRGAGRGAGAVRVGGLRRGGGHATSAAAATCGSSRPSECRPPAPLIGQFAPLGGAPAAGGTVPA